MVLSYSYHVGSMFILRLTIQLFKIITAILRAIENMPSDHFKKNTVDLIAIESAMFLRSNNVYTVNYIIKHGILPRFRK